MARPALANALASFVGSYPWFFAFNLAMRWLPAAAPGHAARSRHYALRAYLPRLRLVGD